MEVAVAAVGRRQHEGPVGWGGTGLCCVALPKPLPSIRKNRQARHRAPPAAITRHPARRPIRPLPHPHLAQEVVYGVQHHHHCGSKTARQQDSKQS